MKVSCWYCCPAFWIAAVLVATPTTIRFVDAIVEQEQGSDSSLFVAPESRGDKLLLSTKEESLEVSIPNQPKLRARSFVTQNEKQTDSLGRKLKKDNVFEASTITTKAPKEEECKEKSTKSPSETKKTKSPKSAKESCDKTGGSQAPSSVPSAAPSKSASPSAAPSDSNAPSSPPSDSLAPSISPSTSLPPSSGSAFPSMLPSSSGQPSGTPSTSGVPSGTPTTSNVPSQPPSTSGIPSSIPSSSGVPSSFPSTSGAPSGLPSSSSAPSAKSALPSAVPSASVGPSAVPSSSSLPTGTPTTSSSPSISQKPSRGPFTKTIALTTPDTCLSGSGLGCSNEAGTSGNPTKTAVCFDVTDYGGYAPFLVTNVIFWLDTATTIPSWLDVYVWEGTKTGGPNSNVILSQTYLALGCFFTSGKNDIALEFPVVVTQNEFCVGVGSDDPNSGLLVGVESGTGDQSFVQAQECGDGSFDFIAIKDPPIDSGGGFCIEAIVTSEGAGGGDDGGGGGDDDIDFDPLGTGGGNDGGGAGDGDIDFDPFGTGGGNDGGGAGDGDIAGFDLDNSGGRL